MAMDVLLDDHVCIGPASPERGDTCTPRNFFSSTCPWHLKALPRSEFPLYYKGRGTEIDVWIEHLCMQRGNQLPVAHL